MDTMQEQELGSFLDDEQVLQYAEAEQPEAAFWIDKIAAGNADAKALMWAFWNFQHMFDDLVDRDKPVTQEVAARELLEFVRQVSFNPFWEQWKWHLFPMFASTVERWLVGEAWPDKKEAAVIRCGDVDFMLQVAYCVGGWNHMRACAAARSYDKED